MFLQLRISLNAAEDFTERVLREPGEDVVGQACLSFQHALAEASGCNIIVQDYRLYEDLSAYGPIRY